MIARVDFLYEPRTVIEVMGYRWHSSARQLARDAARRNRLTLDGYEVLEYTYGQVIETPQTVWTELATSMGFAPPAPPRRPRSPSPSDHRRRPRGAGSVIRSA